MAAAFKGDINAVKWELVLPPFPTSIGLNSRCGIIHLTFSMLWATSVTKIYKQRLSKQEYSDATEGFITLGQYIQEVKALLNYHWLLRYPLMCKPAGTVAIST